MLLMMLEYKFEGHTTRRIINLVEDDAMPGLRKTLIWAAHNGVVVSLTPTKVEAKVTA